MSTNSPRMILALLGLALILSACGGKAADETAAAVPPTPEEAGRLLYERHGCGLCHGPGGGGDGPLAATLERPPRDLRDPASYTFGPDEREILIVLEEGISDFGDSIMPSYRHLDAEERTQLARYVISIQDRGSPAGEETP